MELINKLKNKVGFTERESQIADYILENSENIFYMTSRELASQTYTSATVIIRFSQKIGYQGFNDF